ncbi:MAG: hypothetical protein ACE5KA_06615 [Nitrososphaerales archaeon]
MRIVASSGNILINFDTEPNGMIEQLIPADKQAKEHTYKPLGCSKNTIIMYPLQASFLS